MQLWKRGITFTLVSETSFPWHKTDHTNKKKDSGGRGGGWGKRHLVCVHTEVVCQVEVSPFCQSCWEVCLYFLQGKKNKVHNLKLGNITEALFKTQNGEFLIVLVVCRLHKPRRKIQSCQSDGWHRCWRLQVFRQKWETERGGKQKERRTFKCIPEFPKIAKRFI